MVGLQLPGVYSTRQSMDCKRSIHNSLTPERGTFRRNPRHPRQGPLQRTDWTLSALSYSATALRDIRLSYYISPLEPLQTWKVWEVCPAACQTCPSMFLSTIPMPTLNGKLLARHLSPNFFSYMLSSGTDRLAY